MIQETLRTASILSFTFREAVHDVEFEGYLIPKGWKVLPLFRSIHHCADFFPQPEKFDPSRFEVIYSILYLLFPFFLFLFVKKNKQYFRLIKAFFNIPL